MIIEIFELQMAIEVAHSYHFDMLYKERTQHFLCDLNRTFNWIVLLMAVREVGNGNSLSKKIMNKFTNRPKKNDNLNIWHAIKC